MEGVGGQTPKVMETPIPRFGANSVHGKSSYYGGGMSPGFVTPLYSYSQREFSEHQMDNLPSSSPMPMQSPFVYNQPSNTPLLPGGLSNMSPRYNPGGTSLHNNSIYRPSSQMRSPSYLFQGSASSSPNYSSLRSQSPDYSSPGGSSGRYSSSPNYSPYRG